MIKIRKLNILILFFILIVTVALCPCGEFINANATTDTFNKQLESFPQSYRSALTKLHTTYPNWNFYPEQMSMSLEDAAVIELPYKQVSQSSGLSWRSMGVGGYDWNTQTWVVTNGGWCAASREVIMYYLDPRNFLNSNDIYMYASLKYDSKTQTKEGLGKIIAGTFLEKGYYDSADTAYGGSYVNVLMEAAKQSNVSSYVLAATILQEQGTSGSSSLISGKYKGYENLYNFFNVRASGANTTQVIENGLKYAKLVDASIGKVKWSTRSASIIGGAKFFGKNYTNNGQDTYFYMNYDIKQNDGYIHQYAQAVHNAVSSGKLVSKAYVDLKNAQADFRIPVFKNMPSTAISCPDKNSKLNNYYFNSINIPGLTPTYSRTVNNYDLSVSGNSTVGVSVPSGAAYKGAGSFKLSTGNNRIVLPVVSQTGYTNNYILNVRATSSCTLAIDASGGSGSGGTTVSILRGDTNGDKKITLIDLANVQRHLLKIIVLKDNNFAGADTNADGKITLIDLANIQRHLLGIKKLN